jgi:hypothetical protein
MTITRQPLIVRSFCEQHDDGNATIPEENCIQPVYVVVVQHSLCTRASRERETRGFIAAYSGCGAANTPCAIPHNRGAFSPDVSECSDVSCGFISCSLQRHLL